MNDETENSPGKKLGITPQQIAGKTMKAVQMYSPYGYRAKIGLIVPSTNTVNEPEFNMMAPAGVSIHSARIMLLGKATEASYFKMGEETSRAASELGTAEVDVIAWGCTSGSVVLSREKLEGMIVEASGIPAATTISSVLAALDAVGAKNIALGTPYVNFVNEAEVKFLDDAGLKVISWYGLELGETQEERRGIGRVPPESLFRLVRYIDRPEVDTIFLSCTNLATVQMIADIEEEIGKPVITSNQATFWRALRMAGVPDKIEGFGRLLQEY
jgi:maleate cis-trans isomerase